MVIYVGNLPLETSQYDLSERFEQYGLVTSINILRDEISGNALGFAFIEMSEESAALQSIAGLDRTRIKDRTVIVCQTAPRTERRRSVKKIGIDEKQTVAADSAPEQTSS